jgi:hypothetical protein
MAIYILIKAQDDLSEDTLPYMTGYPIDFFDHNALFGRSIPPKFCQLKITDDSDYEALKVVYNTGWKKLIEWEFINHNYTVDGHRLRVWMDSSVRSSSGLNSLTLEQVETWLNKWGAIVHDTAPNEVTFDVIVYEDQSGGPYGMIKSDAFWDRDVSLLSWDENSYDPGTGVHNFDVDYSVYMWGQDKVEKRIVDVGGTIISSGGYITTFEISRAAIFAVFKENVKDAVEAKAYSRRRFLVPSQYVVAAITNGGTLEITKQQFLNNIYDRLND